MSHCVANFTITKGVDNTFVFTIKEDGSTLPMVIESSDTFKVHLVQLKDSSTVLTKQLTTVDALSGKISLVLTAAEVNSLDGDRGTKADRYYLRPTYKIVIECSTSKSGDFIAKVPEVYVD